jgi:hypothetical protein
MLDIISSTSTIISPQVTQSIHNTLTDLLQLVLLGVTTLAGLAIRTWLASMNSGWKKSVAIRLVKFAEQRLASNKEKLDYVALKLHEHFPRLSEEEIHQLLEEAVNNLSLTGIGTGLSSLEGTK